MPGETDAPSASPICKTCCGWLVLIPQSFTYNHNPNVNSCPIKDFLISSRDNFIFFEAHRLFFTSVTVEDLPVYHVYINFIITHIVAIFTIFINV